MCGQAQLGLHRTEHHQANVSELRDLQDIIGQQQGKRALEIAAAGNHNLLFLGPPGTGKTMLASRLRDLLPEMSDDEAMETASVASLTQQEINQYNWKQRPFRSLTIQVRWRHWWVVAQCLAPERYLWRITAYCSWMKCRSLNVRCLIHYENH